MKQISMVGISCNLHFYLFTNLKAMFSLANLIKIIAYTQNHESSYNSTYLKQLNWSIIHKLDL